MDDHVHLLAEIGASTTIQREAQKWKSVSAHRLTREHGRIAPVWQREYYDRSIRGSVELRACIAYILNNPRKRWPSLPNYAWVFRG